MKKGKSLFPAAVFVTAVVLSFFGGQYTAQQQFRQHRSERCKTLISFAINKAENKDLSEDVVLDALISNLYAAHEFCDDPYVSAHLNDLWNTLVVDESQLVQDPDMLADQLRELRQHLAEAE